MANTIIRPTFATPTAEVDDRLTFLSRLWGVTISAADYAAYAATRLTYPVRGVETGREYRALERDWKEQHYYRNVKFIALWKWDHYGIGPVKPPAQAYLDGIGRAPNRTEARQAVKLQLQVKYHFEIERNGIDIDTDLLPLISGLDW